jgi:hypothetical protein
MFADRLARRYQERLSRQTLMVNELSQDRICVLRRRWDVPPDTRHRGPSPSQVHYLLRSPVLRNEAAAAASLCVALSLVPTRASAKTFAEQFYRPATAERLCDAYDGGASGHNGPARMKCRPRQRGDVELGKCEPPGSTISE